MYPIKTYHISSDMKVSDIILGNPYFMLLLEHFSIDVPLLEKSVQEICIENEINVELFLIFANLYNGVKYDSKAVYDIAGIPTIINYLKSSHRYYLEDIYPNIKEIIRQMNAVNDLKEMALVGRFFEEYFNEVSEHLSYENDIVFPYIIALNNQISNSNPVFDPQNYSVSNYKAHHNDIEEKLNDLKNLLIKYLPLKNDRAIRRKLLFSLSELEYDLNIHSQIEDMILIPLVGKMESFLKKSK